MVGHYWAGDNGDLFARDGWFVEEQYVPEVAVRYTPSFSDIQNLASSFSSFY
jgi:hypothetical protein